MVNSSTRKYPEYLTEGNPSENVKSKVIHSAVRVLGNQILYA